MRWRAADGATERAACADVALRADATARVKRKKAGGNSGKKFTEGCARSRRSARACARSQPPPPLTAALALRRCSWVEFAEKKVAKSVAAMLNGQQIGARLYAARTRALAAAANPR